MNYDFYNDTYKSFMGINEMFFKRKIEIEIQKDNMFLDIYALYQDQEIARIKCTINKKNKQIRINDINCKKNNKGYGSLMMEKLIDFAKANKFDVITGWLSCADKGHEKRLYHFYQKFGFEITPNDEGVKFADIKLRL